MSVSRRDLFAGLGWLAGIVAALPAAFADTAKPTTPATTEKIVFDDTQPGAKTLAMLRARLGDEIYQSWFKSMEFEAFEGGVVTFSLPVKFVRNWVNEHYKADVLDCALSEFAFPHDVKIAYRHPAAGRDMERLRREASEQYAKLMAELDV